MSAKRYPQKFKIEAIKQMTERGHAVADVASQLGVSTDRLYKWIRQADQPTEVPSSQLSQADELRRRKSQLKLKASNPPGRRRFQCDATAKKVPTQWRLQRVQHLSAPWLNERLAEETSRQPNHRQPEF